MENSNKSKRKKSLISLEPLLNRFVNIIYNLAREETGKHLFELAARMKLNNENKTSDSINPIEYWINGRRESQLIESAQDVWRKDGHLAPRYIHKYVDDLTKLRMESRLRVEGYTEGYTEYLQNNVEWNGIITWMNERLGNTTKDDLEYQSVDDLKELGLESHTIPAGIYPGMIYFTPAELVDSGATKYSYAHVFDLLRKGHLDSFRIGNQFILTAAGVRQLLEREKASLAGSIRSQGRRPGTRRRA